MDTLVHLQNSPFLIGLCRNGAPADLQYDNSSELFRISTFALFPAAAVTERTLARAGWVYTGVGDRVQCFRCKVTAEGWQTGDCPTERHRQLSPSCAFIQSLPSTANLLSSSHSAFSPLCSAHVIPVRWCQDLASPPPRLCPNPGPVKSRWSRHSRYGPFNYLTNVSVGPTKTPSCHNPSMRREQDRLDSFQSWISVHHHPSELAKAGFYYLGQGDRVACFTCGGQLSNWEPGDRAVSEHQRHYPNCRFVRGDRADNVSMAGGPGGLGVPPRAVALSLPPGLSNVSNPAMQQREERLLTFVHWPLRIPVRPDQLAKAGFYYVGETNIQYLHSNITCILYLFCLTGPWQQMSLYFNVTMVTSRCVYLLQEKGQEFVHQIQARFPRLFEQLLTNGDSISREFVDPPMVNLGPGEERSEDAVMMNTPVVVSAVEMGFERGLVKQTVQSKILTSGENYKTVQELVSDLLSAEDQKREEEKEMLAEEMASAQANEASSPSQDLSDLPMEEQLRRLQEERTCKVCMDKEVNMVFIPCGHLVVCKECAPSLRKCPICRGLVKGTVRTFLS
nr:LOW QUALITY PROTEIN: baculoviral IAP repeat-containing protein 3-like [Salvelinus alpinus]